ncbi:MAG TPA: SMC-Scp complex subunit ScpB [Terriglobales bacterium]|nr:SMC-Scp complex subunit ScpB [Terriglobales bacterium]
MSLKSKIEAIIYAAEDPVTVEQIAGVIAEGEPPAGEDRKAALAALKQQVREAITELAAEYDLAERGMEIRAVAGGYRMATRPEHHDAVRAFAKSLKPPVRLSLQALETLAVIAYKQPVTVPEISEIRGVDASGVIGTLLDRKLITTAGRKAVIGRPILYKTSKEFLLRFGLSDLGELPSMEEFEKLAAGSEQADLFPTANAAEADATGVPDAPAEEAEPAAQDDTADEVRTE